MLTVDPAAEVYLALGGNVGDVVGAMQWAVDELRQAPHCKVTAISPVYETPPWGLVDQDRFHNCVLCLETMLSPQEILALALGLEKKAGRMRGKKWGPRTLDIDVLLYGDANVDEPDLTIPHRHMLERAFVMVPLADIAAEKMISGVRIADHAARLDSVDMNLAEKQLRFT